MVKRAAVYCRISRDAEGRQLGVERQREDCEALCRREGWEVAQVYVDNDRSAYGGKQRPAWTRLLSDADDRRFDVLVAWHDDRMWRNVVEQQVVFGQLAEMGVAEVVTPHRTYVTSSAEDSFMGGIQALVAQKESADKSRRLRRKAEELAKAGKVGNGGARPFGYEQDRMTVRADEAVEIRAAVKRLLAGEGILTICKEWNQRGITTTPGGQWRATSFRRMICSPRIAGLREHRGEVVAVAVWPAILDRPTHERLRSLLLDPARRTSPGPQRRYLMTGGIVRCGLCGKGLAANMTSQKKRAYWCSSAPHIGGCGKIRVTAERIDHLVRDMVLAALAGPALANALAAVARDDAEIKTLVDGLARDEGRLEELAQDFYTYRLVTRAEFLSARQALEARMEATRRSLAAHESTAVLTDLPSDYDALKALWEARETDIEWRRALLRAVIDRVIVHPAPYRGGPWNPDRVEIIWRA